MYPSEGLLAMEQKVNDSLYTYCKQYFMGENVISSSYFFDTDGTGFGAAYLINKVIENEGKVKKGQWDSNHVVSVMIDGKNATYKVVSAVILQLLRNDPDNYGQLEMAGTLTTSVR